MLGLLLAIAPLLLACFISGSRAVDNYHHWSDVAFGSFLGLASALFAIHLHLPDSGSQIAKSRRRQQKRTRHPVAGDPAPAWSKLEEEEEKQQSLMQQQQSPTAGSRQRQQP